MLGIIAGVAGSVLGGAIASSGAKSAAKTQAKSADQAAQLQYDLGNKSLDQQQRMFDAQIGMYERARDQQISVAQEAERRQIGGYATNTNQQIAQHQNALLAQLGAAQDSRNQNLNIYNEQGSRWQPYLDAGRQGIANMANPSGFTADPGYQFRLSEGQDALNRQAAATGMRMSGAALKDANNYAQGQASQAYGDWWNRQNSLAGYGANAAGAMGQAGQNYAANAIGINSDAASAVGVNAANVAGALGSYGANVGNVIGQTAANIGNAWGGYSSAAGGAAQGVANGTANINQSVASGMGNALMAGGAARASGYQGAANAWGNALGGIGSTIGAAQAGYFGQNPGFGIKPYSNPYSSTNFGSGGVW